MDVTSLLSSRVSVSTPPKEPGTTELEPRDYHSRRSPVLCVFVVGDSDRPARAVSLLADVDK